MSSEATESTFSEWQYCRDLKMAIIFSFSLQAKHTKLLYMFLSRLNIPSFFKLIGLVSRPLAIFVCFLKGKSWDNVEKPTPNRLFVVLGSLPLTTLQTTTEECTLCVGSCLIFCWTLTLLLRPVLYIDVNISTINRNGDSNPEQWTSPYGVDANAGIIYPIWDKN